MQAGAKIDFVSMSVRDEWATSLDPWLRPVILVACLLYHEVGASRCKIVKLLGDVPPYIYGRAADLGILTIPSVKSAGSDVFYVTPAWITKRINILFPFGDGEKTTADYDGNHIRIEVPPWGYSKHAMPLHSWNEWGNTGRVLGPRRVRL